jgi:hypothetical protein
VFDRITHDDEGRVQYHYVLVDYVCRPLGGTLAAASDVADVAWVAREGLADYRLTDKAIAVIAQGIALASEAGWAARAAGSDERSATSLRKGM